MTKTSMTTLRTLLAAAVVSIVPQAGFAAEGGAEIARQKWAFGGFRGQFDQAQLQRGYQVYSEVCATCHELKRISYRNLAQPGGPAFPLASVQALAASAKVTDGPGDDGKMFQRPGRTADPLPRIYQNEQEARSIHNGAYPPDLSLMARARNTENHAAWYIHPFLMLRDVVNSYQEGGADFIYALMRGYTNPPANFKLADGMHYNGAFPGHQIAMANPFAGGDGLVKYEDGTPATVENYSRDVSAFLSWTADPKLDERKRIGWQVLLYLLVTAVLMYFAKKRVWSRAGGGH
jgi:cytochrome c1